MSPRALDSLLRTCLAKEPAARWRSAHDLALQLTAIANGSIDSTTPGAGRDKRRNWPWMVAVAVSAAAVGVFATWLVRSRAPSVASPEVIRFAVPPPEGGRFRYSVEHTFLAVSPDGSRLAYVASEEATTLASPIPRAGTPRIFIRLLSSLEASPLAGTEGANSLFWSPDGRTIAFFTATKLMRVDSAGGVPVSICEPTAAGGGRSGTWGLGDDILFSGTPSQEIFLVHAAGGTPRSILKMNPSRGEMRLTWPWFLPDGKRFLYQLHRSNGRHDVMLAGPGLEPQPVMPSQSRVQYAEGPGALVFVHDGSLLGQRFDWRTGKLSGGPFSIAARTRFFSPLGSASFAVGRSGTVAYQAQGSSMRLVWFDRGGREVGTLGPPGEYVNLSMSRDGRRLVFDRSQAETGSYDVWLADLERGTETRVTSGPVSEFNAIWLPGEKAIAYSTAAGVGTPRLFRRDLATRTDEVLGLAGGFQTAQDVSPDGRELVYTERTQRGSEAFALPLAGGKPVRLFPSVGRKWNLRFSPDGRAMAFTSDESGQSEAYVVPYPGPGEMVRVSTGGAGILRWDRAGTGLLYVSADQRLISVTVRTSPSITVGTPVPLFALAGRGWLNYEVSPDGKRFLAIVQEVVADELPLTVVTGAVTEPRK